MLTQITLCYDEFSKSTRCVCIAEPVKAVPLPYYYPFWKSVRLYWNCCCKQQPGYRNRTITKRRHAFTGDHCSWVRFFFFQLLLSFWLQVINYVCKLSNSLLFLFSFCREPMSNKESTINKLRKTCMNLLICLKRGSLIRLKSISPKIKENWVQICTWVVD